MIILNNFQICNVPYSMATLNVENVREIDENEIVEIEVSLTFYNFF